MWRWRRITSFSKLKPSTKTISLRMPETLLDRLKIEAHK
ncbi:CopG family antitoxin [Vreelandella neptunia]